MPGNGKQVDRHLFNINRKHTGALRRINHKKDALLATPGANFFDCLKCAADIGAMSHDNETGTRDTCLANSQGVYQAKRIGSNTNHIDALVAQCPQRPNDCVVFHRRGNNSVTGTKSAKKAKIDGLGGVGSESDA